MSGRPDLPRMRPLGGSSDWRTASEVGVTVAASGIALTALPDGPLGLNDPEDTLGGLIAPRWLAVSGDVVYRIDSCGVLRHLDCVAQQFVGLPGELGLAHERRTDVAAARDRLAVVEAEELHVYDRATLARVAVLDSDTTSGESVTSVAIGRSGVVALDAAGRLWHRTPAGWDAIAIDAASPRWRRVAIDVGDGIHVLGDTDAGPVLFEVASDGRLVAEIHDPREVASRFGPAQIGRASCRERV